MRTYVSGGSLPPGLCCVGQWVWGWMACSHPCLTGRGDMCIVCVCLWKCVCLCVCPSLSLLPVDETCVLCVSDCGSVCVCVCVPLSLLPVDETRAKRHACSQQCSWSCGAGLRVPQYTARMSAVRPASTLVRSSFTLPTADQTSQHTPRCCLVTLS